MAQQADVSAKAGSLGTVHQNGDFDAGNGARIGHIGKAAHPVHDVANVLHGQRLIVGIARRDLQVHGFARSRSAALGLDLHFNARHTGADIHANLGSCAAGVPRGQLQLECPDGFLVALSRTHHRARIDAGDFIIAQQTVFYGADQCVPLENREVVPRADLHLHEVRLDRREKADPFAKLPISAKAPQQQGDGKQKRGTRAQNGPFQHAHIAAGKAAHVAWVTEFGGVECGLGPRCLGLALADQSAYDGDENQCHEQGCKQRQDHGDGQELHKFAHHPLPEQQR